MNSIRYMAVRDSSGMRIGTIAYQVTSDIVSNLRIGFSLRHPKDAVSKNNRSVPFNGAYGALMASDRLRAKPLVGTVDRNANKDDIKTMIFDILMIANKRPMRNMNDRGAFPKLVPDRLARFAKIAAREHQDMVFERIMSRPIDAPANEHVVPFNRAAFS